MKKKTEYGVRNWSDYNRSSSNRRRAAIIYTDRGSPNQTTSASLVKLIQNNLTK